MVLGLNGLAIRAPDAKLPPNCTESHFGAIGTSPGARDQKEIPLTLIGIRRALYNPMMGLSREADRDTNKNQG